MNPSRITVSLAQVPIVKGSVRRNLDTHLSYIAKSSRVGADVVIFPELSLTGYELELAETLACQEDAAELKALSKAAIDHSIVVVAGCPLVTATTKPTIGAVVCFPNGNIEFYAKQYLHDGEEVYCSAGTNDYFFTINGYRLALAICADFSEPMHAARAAEQGADMYITSALISESGYDADARILSNIAAQHQIPVLLSNHISQTGGWAACGRNALWDSTGKLIMSSESKDECLVLCTVGDGKMTGTVRHG